MWGISHLEKKVFFYCSVPATMRIFCPEKFPKIRKKKSRTAYGREFVTQTYNSRL